MIDAKLYRCVSSTESPSGVGVKIYVAIPRDRTLSDFNSSQIEDACYSLYQGIQSQLHKSHPDEIQATKKEKEKILALFGGQAIFVEEVPNDYDPRYGRPWFVVTTKIGRIKLGWRKRVINIDWSETVGKIEAEKLFKEENVTKGDYYIHAWDYEAAKKYLDKLFELK